MLRTFMKDDRFYIFEVKSSIANEYGNCYLVEPGSLREYILKERKYEFRVPTDPLLLGDKVYIPIDKTYSALTYLRDVYEMLPTV